jgi:hypothetical protein
MTKHAVSGRRRPRLQESALHVRTDADAALDEASVPTATADGIVQANEQSQIDGSRSAEAILAPFGADRPPFHARHPDCSTWRPSQAEITP